MPLREHSPANGKPVSTATLGSAEDANLLEGIKARDVRALERLYRKYRPRLTWFLSKRTSRQQVVEEAIDETMLAVWNNPHSFRGASRFSTWICAIAQRRVLKLLKRNRVTMESWEAGQDSDDGQGLHRDEEDDRISRQLATAIGQLTPEQRAVIELAYYEDKPYREMSEILKCPVSTVKTRVFHAKRQLRNILAGIRSDWL
jgi:RNA polymerase sigma-70 factor (ECF subfamily)